MIGGAIGFFSAIFICICTFLSASMLDELLNYYPHVSNCSELVFIFFGAKGKTFCAMMRFIELYCYVMQSCAFGGSLLYSLDTPNAWAINDMGKLSFKTSIILVSLAFLPLRQLTDLKPLAKLSGVGLFGVLSTYIIFVYYIY